MGCRVQALAADLDSVDLGQGIAKLLLVEDNPVNLDAPHTFASRTLWLSAPGESIAQHGAVPTGKTETTTRLNRSVILVMALVIFGLGLVVTIRDGKRDSPPAKNGY